MSPQTRCDFRFVARGRDLATRGSGIDPAAKKVALRLNERFVGKGHPSVFIGVGQTVEEFAGVGFARDNHGVFLRAFE